MQNIQFDIIETINFQMDEAFKTLRTNIRFCGEERKVIAFTSCVPNEGKSTIVFRLAVSMAESGKKVLLLDADIRKSIMVAKYHVNKKVPGLSEYITGQCKLNECLCDTNIENMHVIFTGPVAPNPSELLGDNKFKDMIKELRNKDPYKYDYILIDCPPLGTVIDAAVVSEVSDGAIMIIEADQISRRFVQKVKRQLEMSGCHILGAVLNKVDRESVGYYGRYYSKYYEKIYKNTYYGTKQ